MWLSEQFPDSKLRFLQCGLSNDHKKPGRPRKHASGASRTAAYRADRQAAVAELGRLLFPNTGRESGKAEGRVTKMLLDTNSNIVTSIHGSVFENKLASKPSIEVVGYSVKEFEQFLGDRAETVIEDKTNNLLFCPSIFDPVKSGATNRGKENFVASFSIWLDFDGGDLDPESLAALFPDIRMTIYNTYQSTANRLRYRAYIPVDAILTYDAYEGIARQIMQRNRGRWLWIE